MCTPLVAIRFSTSAQLIPSDLISCYAGGPVVVRRKWRRKERVLEEIGDDKSNKRSRLDLNIIAISQTAVGAVGSK
jgi:hypothetical protein